MTTKRDYKKGDVVMDGPRFVTITGERCWQCRHVSVGNYTTTFSKKKGAKPYTCETCVNGCGPRGLSQMLNF